VTVAEHEITFVNVAQIAVVSEVAGRPISDSPLGRSLLDADASQHEKQGLGWRDAVLTLLDRAAGFTDLAVT